MSTEYVVMPKSDCVSTCKAIRNKTGTTELIKSNELSGKIEDVYNAGYEKGYEQSITDNVKEEQEKIVEITENDTYDILPDEGKVLSKVTVNANVADIYYDVFWDNYQKNGDWFDAQYMFAGSIWTDDNFKPKYNIHPLKSAYTMFNGSGICNLAKILKDCNVKLDTSDCVNLFCMFNQSKVTHCPTLSLIKATSLSQLFYSCTYLVFIESLIISRSTVLTGNMFSGCAALSDITIEGEIGSTFNINGSPLTAKSAISVLTHLVNYTGTENEFVYSVLFADSVWELLNAEGATAPGDITWEEYVASIGWKK